MTLPSFKPLFAATVGGLALCFTLTPFVAAQDDEAVETVETVETVKSTKPKNVRPSARGPITAIRPAALWLVTLDGDNDYVITRAEFETGLKADFKRQDKNNDGKLSLFDIEDWRARALGSDDARPHALQFDDNYDSSISRREFESTLTHLFNLADEDESNTIVFSELVSIVERPRAPRREVQERLRERPQTRRPRTR